MKEEVLDVFNDEMKICGKAFRSEVHKRGLWHQTFHCWILQKIEGDIYIIFQKRQYDKDTFPGLYDTSCAGHLSTGESEKDGVRELEEELGLKIDFDKLTYLGMSKEILKYDTFVDKEYHHLFAYMMEDDISNLTVQKEEVSGVIKVSLNSVIDLFTGAIDHIEAEGFEIDNYEKKLMFKKNLNIRDFVPHDKEYYINVFKLCKQINELKRR